MKRTYCRKGTPPPKKVTTPQKVLRISLVLKERPMQLLGTLQELAQDAADLCRTKEFPNVYTVIKVLAILVRVVINYLKRPRH